MHVDAPGHVGRFRFPTDGGRWWWSDGMFEIHGMSPGEIVPTLEVVLHHALPQHRAALATALTTCAVDGQPFGLQYSLLDLAGNERSVTLSGAGEREGDVLRAVTGFVVDVGPAQHEAVARAVNAELSRALESHAVIDQAKGALMLVYGIDGDAAFELLRWSSQQRNVRLVVLAERLVSAVEQAGGLSPAVRARLDDVFLQSMSDDGAGGAATEADVGSRLHVTASTDGRVPVLHVRGPVDLATAPELTSAIAQMSVPARAAGRLLLDLTEAAHVGSVGVSVLVAAQRRCSSSGVRLQILAAPDSTLTLAGDLGLDVRTVSRGAPTATH